MWKMTGWLAKTIAAGLLISFLSIWTTGYIVNSYVETLLKQFNVPLEQKPFALNGVWGGLWGADPVVKQKENAADTDSSSKDKDANVKTGSSADKNDDSTSSDSDSPASVDAFEQTPSGELSDIGGGTGTKAGSGVASKSDDEVAMSTDEINTAKSQISDSDKEKLFDTLTKLPQDAWQNISKLMEDGLTDAEMTQVQQLMAQYLDRTEYDAMLAILSKY